MSLTRAEADLIEHLIEQLIEEGMYSIYRDLLFEIQARTEMFAGVLGVPMTRIEEGVQFFRDRAERQQPDRARKRFRTLVYEAKSWTTVH